MARRRRKRRRTGVRRYMRWPPPLPRRLPRLEQRHRDLIGLGFIALGVFLALVLYAGGEGGKVGGWLADALALLLGRFAYATPPLLCAAGAVLMLRPVLPRSRPLRAGAACLVAAGLLGLAAGTLGLGPDGPARTDDFMGAGLFRERGGIAGEALYWAAATLFQSAGAHILAIFLALCGVLLLSGATVAGVARSVRGGVAALARGLRDLRVHGLPLPFRPERLGGRPGIGEPAPPAPGEPPDVEPVVRATHVEAPALDGARRFPDLYGGRAQPLDPDAGDPGAHGAPVTAAGRQAETGPDGEPVPEPAPEPGLTPQGNRRSTVTEADETDWRLPQPGLLTRGKRRQKASGADQERTGAKLVEALGHFGVEASMVGAVAGPHVTRYELRLAPGTKMSKVSQLKDDLAYALAATDVRILAPIPGKRAVGVEVPNEVRRIVHLGDVFQDPPQGWSPLTVWLGKDIAGKAIGTDLAKQPHVLVAGTTGSGKSGSINAMLASILLRASPNDVRLALVDPKQVELNHYDDIPHLLTPVVTSPRSAANVLANLIREMEARYGLMSVARTRSLPELNRRRAAAGEPHIPYILCVIEELGDLMMIAPAEVEDAIIRLAQKSRAVGIHLLLATQRPSADVITGLIKANVPARIAFAVSSQTDSRVILDQNGAESLLGQGDMLFRPASESRSARIQGAFVTEEEILHITDHWRRQGEPELREDLLEAVEGEGAGEGDGDGSDPDADELLPEAIATVVQMGAASTSMLQRRLRVGYTRAGRLIDMMERRGVISGYEGSKARQVLIGEGDVSRVLAALEESPVRS